MWFRTSIIKSMGFSYHHINNMLFRTSILFSQKCWVAFIIPTDELILFRGVESTQHQIICKFGCVRKWSYSPAWWTLMNQSTCSPLKRATVVSSLLVIVYFPVKSTKRLPWGKLGSWRYGGFLKWGYPQSSSISNDGIFPTKNHPALGYPHDYGKPHILFLVVRKGKSWWTNWIGYPKLESRKTMDLLIGTPWKLDQLWSLDSW